MSSFLSKLVSWDISIVSIFIQFVCPCPCSVFSVWCKGNLRYDGLAPMHIWLLEVAKLCCVLDWTLRNCSVWPTYICIPCML